MHLQSKAMRRAMAPKNRLYVQNLNCPGKNKYSGFGTGLMQAAIEQSLIKGYKGHVGFQATGNSHRFYVSLRFSISHTDFEDLQVLYDKIQKAAVAALKENKSKRETKTKQLGSLSHVFVQSCIRGVLEGQNFHLSVLTDGVPQAIRNAFSGQVAKLVWDYL